MCSLCRAIKNPSGQMRVSLSSNRMSQAFHLKANLLRLLVRRMSSMTSIWTSTLISGA